MTTANFYRIFLLLLPPCLYLVLICSIEFTQPPLLYHLYGYPAQPSGYGRHLSMAPPSDGGICEQEPYSADFYSRVECDVDAPFPLISGACCCCSMMREAASLSFSWSSHRVPMYPAFNELFHSISHPLTMTKS